MMRRYDRKLVHSKGLLTELYLAVRDVSCVVSCHGEVDRTQFRIARKTDLHMQAEAQDKKAAVSTDQVDRRFLQDSSEGCLELVAYHLASSSTPQQHRLQPPQSSWTCRSHLSVSSSPLTHKNINHTNRSHVGTQSAPEILPSGFRSIEDGQAERA